jgi:hypothetical protein
MPRINNREDVASVKCLRQSGYLPSALLCSILLLAHGPYHTAAGQQQPPPPGASQAAAVTSLTPSQLEHFLDAAYIRTTEYTASFRDLTAEEKQSVELYNTRGIIVRKREIISDFIVYQSRFDRGVTAEYRNVREVDKVPVPGREERVLRLFKKLASSSSVNQELALLSDEASRYDLNYSIQGYTLKEGLPLQKEVRSVFAFEVEGREQVEGFDVVIVKYMQRAQSPQLKVDLRLPSLPKASESFYRGRLWLDARTAQIRREERELVLAIPQVKEQLVLIRQEFHYTASQFDILVPKRTTLTTLGSVKLDGNRVASSTTGGRLSFEYGPFSRFNVTVPGANVRE